MADQLQIDIVTPQASVYSGPASEVILPAWEGAMGVYPQHDALLALLRAGPCAVTTPQGTKLYVIGRGFADIGPDRVTLLTDSCTDAEAVDQDRARTELAKAEQVLGSELFTTEKFKQAEIAAEHARAVLDIDKARALLR
jgi:F-type H+-transporting ATPase subunit epsilon